VALSLDHLRLQVPSLMDYGQNENPLASDLVEDAVGVERQFPNGLVVDLRYYPNVVPSGSESGFGYY